jgi:xanthine dehydrogenase small subunit
MSTRDYIEFLLDGERIKLTHIDPTMTILRYLRERRGRIGTKEGCAEGDCGACTVVLTELKNGKVQHKAINACIVFMPTLDGKELRTVESIGTADKPHKVQKTMAEKHASQCGFCTPGFVMSLYAFQLSGNSPTRKNVDEALAGNLCRCTGYGPIIDAAMDLGAPDDVPNPTKQLNALQHDDLIEFCADIYGDCKTFFIPKTLTQLTRAATENPDAVFLAGGTDVGLWVTKQHRVLDKIIYLGDVSELNQIKASDDEIEICAGVKYSDALDLLENLYPDMGAVMRRLGSVQIRNLGTIGGNIANGSPIGDMPPLLIAAGADLVLQYGDQERTLALEDFFLEYGKQDRKPGEFVKSIRVPRPSAKQKFYGYKISKRFEQDISALCVGISFNLIDDICHDVRIAYGGMAATPKRATRCEAALTGQSWSINNVENAMTELEQDFTPISDMRASADYRMKTAKNLLMKAYLETNTDQTLRVLEVGHGN